MAADPSEAAEVEKLYQYGERLGEAKDKAQVVGDFEGIIKAVKGQSTNAKQLAAQLIPRFMKFFPALGNGAMEFGGSNLTREPEDAKNGFMFIDLPPVLQLQLKRFEYGFMRDTMIKDAKKGVMFIDLPPVLQLQLKRFEYDLMRDTMVKLNDRYEFPMQPDLDREIDKYISPEADRSVRNLYTLHRISVRCPHRRRLRKMYCFSSSSMILYVGKLFVKLSVSHQIFCQN